MLHSLTPAKDQFVPGVQALPGTISTDFNLLSRAIRLHESLVHIEMLPSAPLHFSQALLDELNAASALNAALRAATEDGVKFQLLTSARPNVFSLGGDLQLFTRLIGESDRASLERYAAAAVTAIWDNLHPRTADDAISIALLEGEAQGGGFEAALSAHVLVAERGTRMGFPEALFGLFPGMGGPQLLEARTDSEVARRIIGSCHRYPAEMLHEIGIVDILADRGEGRAAVERLVERGHDDAGLTRLRARFEAIGRLDLEDAVAQWVSQALRLNRRDLKTIEYLTKAQALAGDRSAAARAESESRPLDQVASF